MRPAPIISAAKDELPSSLLLSAAAAMLLLLVLLPPPRRSSQACLRSHLVAAREPFKTVSGVLWEVVAEVVVVQACAADAVAKKTVRSRRAMVIMNEKVVDFFLFWIHASSTSVFLIFWSITNGLSKTVYLLPLY